MKQTLPVRICILVQLFGAIATCAIIWNYRQQDPRDWPLIASAVTIVTGIAFTAKPFLKKAGATWHEVLCDLMVGAMFITIGCTNLYFKYH